MTPLQFRPLNRRACAPALLVAAGLLSTSAPAWARIGGIAAEGCSGCHGGTGDVTLSVSTNPATFQPNSSIEVLLTINSDGINAAGVYITTKGVGTLNTISGQGLSKVNNGLVHSQPKAASGGQVDFRFSFQAPGDPGTVRFFVYALGANGNGQRSGDRPKNGIFDYVFGCDGQQYYSDEDDDGFGRDAFTYLACVGQPPAGFVENGGDCIDYDPKIYPTATEVCNLKDDDCNGEVDENALPVMLYPDADGDGYYGTVEDGELVGDPIEGCVGEMIGWAAQPGDCYPLDPTIHPDAEEICNYYDENCDGEVDERSRAVCGVGWCARESPTCNPEECKPGMPQPELCNLLDDDCDGLVDEIEDGALCPAGEDCGNGACVPIGSLPPSSGGAPAAGGSGSGSGSNSGGVAPPPSTARSSPADSGCSIERPARPGVAWLLGALLLGLARRRRSRSLAGDFTSF